MDQPALVLVCKVMDIGLTKFSNAESRMIWTMLNLTLRSSTFL